MLPRRQDRCNDQDRQSRPEIDQPRRNEPKASEEHSKDIQEESGSHRGMQADPQGEEDRDQNERRPDSGDRQDGRECERNRPGNQKYRSRIHGYRYRPYPEQGMQTSAPPWILSLSANTISPHFAHGFASKIPFFAGNG